jgi:hypothetical protein
MSRENIMLVGANNLKGDKRQFGYWFGYCAQKIFERVGRKDTKFHTFWRLEKAA